MVRKTLAAEAAYAALSSGTITGLQGIVFVSGQEMSLPLAPTSALPIRIEMPGMPSGLPLPQFIPVPESSLPNVVFVHMRQFLRLRQRRADKANGSFRFEVGQRTKSRREVREAIPLLSYRCLLLSALFCATTCCCVSTALNSSPYAPASGEHGLPRRKGAAKKKGCAGHAGQRSR